MKKFKFFLLSLVLTLIFTACTNPNGGYGPSWDITAKIPLIKGIEKNQITIDNLFDGEVNIEKGITMNLVEGDSSLYDLGGELTDFTIELPVGEIPILLGDDISEEELPTIKFNTEFERLTLRESQSVDITVISDVEIKNLAINFYDSNNSIIGSLDIGDITDEYLDDEITICMNMGKVDIDGKGAKIGAVGEVDEDGEINITIDFPDGLAVDSITRDVGEYFSDSKTEIDVDPIELDFDQELKDELRKIEVSPEVMIHLVSLDGMEINITDDITFTTFRSNGTVIENIEPKIEEVEKFDLKKVLQLEGMDILDLILDPEAVELKVTGSYEIKGEEVTVDHDSKVGIESIDINIPYEFALKEDMEFKLDPEKIEPIDQDTRKLLQDRVEGMLVIEKLNNNFPLAITMEIYTASIPGNWSEEDIEEILYSGDNMIKRVSVQQRESYNNFSIEVEADDLDIFSKKDLYVGIKIIIPANSGDEIYKLNNDDVINFDRIYLGLTGHVNK